MNKTLLVWPNPFHALDQEGHPAGVLPYEPTGDGVKTFDARRFIGARLESKVLEKAIEGTAQQTMQRTWFVYLDEPVVVPDTPYYRHAIARGEIFAADEATGRACGISQGFVKPEDLLERARKEAVDAYERTPPHDDLDGLAPDELVKFTFGPMKEATERRKKAEVEAKKAEADQAKADEAARAAEKKGIEDRAKRRAKRDAEQKEAEEKAAEEAKNEAAAQKVAAEAKAKADAEAKAKADAEKSTGQQTTGGTGRTGKGES